jgi:hypothetical protein
MPSSAAIDRLAARVTSRLMAIGPPQTPGEHRDVDRTRSVPLGPAAQPIGAGLR